MANVSEWSTSAGTNNGAPPAGAPENMLPGKVNDVIREMMAALSKWYQDSTGTLLTGGSSTAYTVTTNSVHQAFSDIPLLSFRVHTASGASPTLNVDALGAKPLRKSAAGDSYAAGELKSGQTLIVQYNTTNDVFEAVGPSISAPVPAGTVMLFVQTAAPTGWTKSVVHNDKALRLVSGTASSGGGTAFSSVMAARIIGTANLPSHSHGSGSLVTASAGLHNHNYSRPDNSTTRSSSGSTGIWQDDTSSFNTSTDGAHTHTISGSTDVTGGGTAMDFNVQYVDVIMATKD